MADVIPFPLDCRARLVREIVDDLQNIHGEAANWFWRSRIAAIVGEMKAIGHEDEEIRTEIFALQHAVQLELRERAHTEASSGSAA